MVEHKNSPRSRERILLCIAKVLQILDVVSKIADAAAALTFILNSQNIRN